MPVLQADDIADLVAGTLRELGRFRFQQIAQQLQRYEVMSKWLSKDRLTIDDGRGIQRTLMMKTGGAARHVGMYERDDVNVQDLLTQMNVPWRHAEAFWVFERREVLMNRGQSLVVNIIEPRRVAARLDLVEELEEKAWACPAATDEISPYGIPYWIVKNATTGFTGGNPIGHASTGGIDRSSNTNFRNYSLTYSAVTKADLIKKMRTMHRKVNWRSPVDLQDYRRNGQGYVVYVNESTMSALEDVGESQNENLGRDIATIDESLTFRRHPIRWVPTLDSDTSNPLYFIDHSVFYAIVLKGDYLYEHRPKPAPFSHNAYVVWTDLSYNYVCVDPRRCGVAYKP